MQDFLSQITASPSKIEPKMKSKSSIEPQRPNTQELFSNAAKALDKIEEKSRHQTQFIEVKDSDKLEEEKPKPKLNPF